MYVSLSRTRSQAASEAFRLLCFFFLFPALLITRTCPGIRRQANSKVFPLFADGTRMLLSQKETTSNSNVAIESFSSPAVGRRGRGGLE